MPANESYIAVFYEQNKPRTSIYALYKRISRDQYLNLTDGDSMTKTVELYSEQGLNGRYQNGNHGIEHGAYHNAYKYQDINLFSNGKLERKLKTFSPLYRTNRYSILYILIKKLTKFVRKK